MRISSFCSTYNIGYITYLDRELDLLLLLLLLPEPDLLPLRDLDLDPLPEREPDLDLLDPCELLGRDLLPDLDLREPERLLDLDLDRDLELLRELWEVPGRELCVLIVLSCDAGV